MVLLALFAAGVWLVLTIYRASDSDYLLQDYPNRLARVLSTEPVAFTPLELELTPLSGRATASAMQAYQLSVRQWWQLKPCQLNDRLAERNSNLGRVQSPSVRLSYEIDMLQALMRCASDTQPTETRDLLLELLSHKRQQLRQVWQHMWLKEPALTKLVTPAHSHFDFGQQGDSEITAVEQALQYLITVSEAIAVLANPQSDNNQLSALNWDSDLFEQHLKVLFHSDVVPQILHSQHQAIASLSMSSALLQANQQLCNDGQHNRSSKLTKAFFGQYYLGTIQPLLGEVKRASDRLTPLMLKLLTNTPSHYQVRFHQIHQQQRFVEVIKAHSKQWQQLFAHCGVTSGEQLKSR
ncbi:hypothetical protein GCM10011369_10120 [Neiella marina]|uniref:DUF3080 family protein n=2 Tax=Neiella marina TaxID=508461 RepID=A0A8J2U3H1_9GAMM|nr:hypothetical protein GCM10011369_10120 [Neiella marina]